VKNRWNSCILRKRKRGSLLAAAEFESEYDIPDYEESVAPTEELATENEITATDYTKAANFENEAGESPSTSPSICDTSASHSSETSKEHKPPSRTASSPTISLEHSAPYSRMSSSSTANDDWRTGTHK
jgi:hypothetical protein